MKALLFDESGPRVTERDVPRISDGDVLVQVRKAGICNTDIEITKGYMGFSGVLGHEMVGVVTEGPPAWMGKRVVSEINFACRQCAACERGLERHCPNRTVMGILGADGALAEYVRIPAVNLHEVPSSLSDEQAVFAEPLAAAFEILEQVHVNPGQRCLVLGDGKLGMLIAMVLQQAGPSVTVSGKHPSHLAFLKKQGIETFSKGDLPDAVQFDVVVEATGSRQGLGEAITRTVPRGTLVLKSTVAENADLSLAPIVINEITVVGSRCGSFSPALRALSMRTVDIEPMIAQRIQLGDAVQGLALAAEKGTLKVLVDVA